MTVKKVWDDAFINFTREELACKSTGGYAFHPGFAEQVQNLRTMLAKPITPYSTCRSEAHNNRVGGSPNSLHIFDKPKRGALGTCAMDIRENDSMTRHELVKLALVLGFSIYFINGNPANIHLDARNLLGEQVRFW